MGILRYSAGNLVRVKTSFFLFQFQVVEDNRRYNIGKMLQRVVKGDILLVKEVLLDKDRIFVTDTAGLAGWSLTSHSGEGSWVEPLSPLEQLAEAAEKRT